MGSQTGLKPPPDNSFDRRADAAALEVQLAVMEADGLADQLADDVEDRGLQRHPQVERIVVGRVLDPPHHR